MRQVFKGKTLQFRGVVFQLLSRYESVAEVSVVTVLGQGAGRCVVTREAECSRELRPGLCSPECLTAGLPGAGPWPPTARVLSTPEGGEDQAMHWCLLLLVLFF